MSKKGMSKKDRKTKKDRKDRKKTKKTGKKPKNETPKKDLLGEILEGMERTDKMMEMTKPEDIHPPAPTGRDQIRNAILDRMGIKTGPVVQQIQRPPVIAAERKTSPPVVPDYLKNLTTKRGTELNKELMEELNVNEMVSDKQRSIIEGYLNSPPKKYEVEASLGTFLPPKPNQKYPSFVPGMTSIVQFNKIIQALQKKTKSFGGSMSERKSITRIDIIINPETGQPYPTRRIVGEGEEDEQGILQVKTDRKTVDVSRWGFRVKKTEEHFNIGDFNFNKVWDDTMDSLEDYKKPSNQKYVPNALIQRYRRRTSFQDSKQGFFYGVSIDLTIVNEVYIRADGTTWQKEKYEVEIERLSTAKKRNLDIKKFLKMIKTIIEFSQDVEVPYQLMGSAEMNYISKFHNFLFKTDITGIQKKNRKFKLHGNQLFSSYWNQPKNVKLFNFLDKEFDPNVTVKLDGTRRFVIGTPIGIYMVKPGKYYEMFRIGPVQPELEGTLLDCEYVEQENDRGEIEERGLYAFDILFNKYQDVRSENFSGRHKLVMNAVEMMDDFLYTSRAYAKKFYTSEDGSIYERNKRALVEAKKLNKKGFETDGLILQPGHWYKNNHTYKWKPSETLTIDFLMKRMTEDEKEEYELEDLEDVYWMMVTNKQNRQLEIFKGNPERGQAIDGYMAFEGDLEGETSLDNRVVECKWDYEYETFYAYRFRDDRGGKPNFLNVAKDVFMDIIDPISAETITGNTLRIMRKYHNQQKNQLLKTYLKPGNTIIDIGSGRGGDLLKWKNAKVGKVYAIEPYEENAEEFVRRREQIFGKENDKISLFLTGAENTDEISDAIEDDGSVIDAVISFFSLTFAAMSKEVYEGIIDTINLVKPGGLFIGTVMEGHKVRELLEEKGSGSISKKKRRYTTEAYSIKQRSEFTDDTFGNLIELDIKDPNTSVYDKQDEALFYFSNFLKIMKSKGFVLKKDGFLDSGIEFKKLPESSKTFSEMMKFFVFEKKEEKKSSKKKEKKEKKSSKKKEKKEKKSSKKKEKKEKKSSKKSKK